MFSAVLHNWTKDFLLRLTPQDFPEKTYLGGGTAIALQLGHRRSVDLDFFTPTTFVETQWQQHLEEKFKFKLLQGDKQTLIGSVNKVKLSLMRYRYKLIGKLEEYNQTHIASLSDLAAMKLDTVMKRGTKRDFVDIYFLSQKFSLNKLFEFYDQKFGNLDESEVMIKKALLFFDDADKQYMPDMLVAADWKKIKEWLVKEVKRI